MNGQNQFAAGNMWGMPMPAGYPWMPTVPFNTGPMQGQQLQQPQQRQQDQTQQPARNFDFIRVNSYDDIKSFFVPPYGNAWFMFQEEPIMAYKFANEMGVTETKYFKFFEFDPKDDEHTKQDDQMVEFASAKYVRELSNKVEELYRQVASISGGVVNNNAEPTKQVYEAEYTNASNAVTTVQRRKQPGDK